MSDSKPPILPEFKLPASDKQESPVVSPAILARAEGLTAKLDKQHRDSQLVEETSRMIQLMADAVTHLRGSREVWHTILAEAKDTMELELRNAVVCPDPQYSLASEHFHKRITELTIRVEILEQLVHSLPLLSEEEINTNQNQN